MDAFIELSDSNLYASGRIIVFADRTEELERTNLNYTPGPGDQFHTVKLGEMLEEISYNYYQYLVPHAGRYWYVLADVNQVDQPLDLSEWVGREIVIPDILTMKLRL